MLGQMSTSVYVPSMPAIAAAFGVGAPEIKTTMTAYLVAFALAQMILGPLSDRIGRRAVLSGGLLIFVLGSLICAGSTATPELLAGRFVQGFGACAGPAVGRAVVRDLFERDSAARAMAAIGLAMAVGPALGPILGGQLQVHFGWPAGFAALTLAGIVMLGAVLRYLPESLPQRDPTALYPLRLLANFMTLARSRVFVRHVLVIGAQFGALFAYVTGLPFVFIDVFGWPPDAFGAVFVFTVGGYLAGWLAAARSIGRVSGERLVGVGVGLSAFGGALMLLATLADAAAPLTIVGPMAICLGGFALALPCALAGAMQPFPMIAGAASALLGLVQMGAAAIGSLAVAALYDGTPLPMAAIIAGIFAASALCWWGMRR